MQLYALVIGLALFPWVGRAQDAPVFSQTFSSGFGSSNLFTQVKFDFGSPGNFLFDAIHFGPLDVGKVFTVSSLSDDPAFNSEVNLVTNGVDNSIAFGLFSVSGSGNAASFLESQLFAGVSRTGPDLAGYQIQSFSFQVDSLTIQSPGSNPNGNGIWTDVSGQITFMIYAAPTPEPSAVYLLGLGILFGSIAFRSRHNQK
jgi:hypothetical protein